MTRRAHDRRAHEALPVHGALKLSFRIHGFHRKELDDCRGLRLPFDGSFPLTLKGMDMSKTPKLAIKTHIKAGARTKQTAR